MAYMDFGFEGGETKQERCKNGDPDTMKKVCCPACNEYDGVNHCGSCPCHKQEACKNGDPDCTERARCTACFNEEQNL